MRRPSRALRFKVELQKFTEFSGLRFKSAQVMSPKPGSEVVDEDKEMTEQDPVLAFEEEVEEIFKTPERKKRIVAAKSKMGLEVGAGVASSSSASGTGTEAVQGEGYEPVEESGRIEEDEEELLADGGEASSGKKKSSERMAKLGSTGERSPGKGSGERGDSRELEKEAMEEKLRQVQAENRAMRDEFQEFMRAARQEKLEAQMREQQRLLDERSAQIRREERELEEKRQKLEDRERLKEDRKEVEDNRTEAVKTIAALPKLAPATAEEDPAIRCGDWLTKVSLNMADMSDTAGHWRRGVKERAETAYKIYLGSSPMARLEVKVEVDEEEKKYDRVTSRAATLLLECIPDQVASELVSTRSTAPEEILFRILVLYQPGGLNERAGLLKQLENIGTINSGSEGVNMLRVWERRKIRAVELGASLPDITILTKAVNQAMQGIGEKHQGLQFRLSLAKAMLNLDTVPTVESLDKYVKMCVAELLQLGPGEEVKTTPRVKKLRQEQQKEAHRHRRQGKEQEEARRERMRRKA